MCDNIKISEELRAKHKGYLSQILHSEVTKTTNEDKEYYYRCIPIEIEDTFMGNSL